MHNAADMFFRALNFLAALTGVVFIGCMLSFGDESAKSAARVIIAVYFVIALIAAVIAGFAIRIVSG